MIEFDKMINEYSSKLRGIYRRYCDDFIMVIPIENEEQCKNHKKFVFEKINSIPNLKISESKTKEYIYQDKILRWKEKRNLVLDYLGFEFNGGEVKIREKSISKFYYRLYKKIDICNKKYSETGNKYLRRGLYRNYSHLGAKPSAKRNGNFITYANKAHKIFDENPSIDNKINIQVKKHWKIINRQLKNKIQ